MKTNILNPQNIYLIPISEEITLFFHTQSLQIYPLKDYRIKSFLQDFKEKGDSILIDSTSHKIYNFICDKITNAPKTVEGKECDTNYEKYDTIVLPIAGRCNLSCPYCFAQTDGGFHFEDFSEQDIENIIKFIIKKNPDSTQPLCIIFFGGEPLMNLNAIKYTINLFKTKYSQYKVNYSITTNGTILNEEIIQIFRENNFAILLSLDGPDNEFNLRKYKNGAKSLPVVIQNINRLKEERIPIQIRATLISSNSYICATYDFFEKLQIPFNIVFAYTSENKTHNYADYNFNNLKNIESQFEELISYYINKIQKKEGLYNETLNEVINNFRYRIKNKIPCAAGVEYFTIMADGTIYSCPHFMNDKKYSIGDLYKDSINKSEFVPVSVDKIKECNNCWAKYLCMGGCPSQKISMGLNNHSSKRQEECELEKLIWVFYLKMYYYITTLMPDMFSTKENQ